MARTGRIPLKMASITINTFFVFSNCLTWKRLFYRQKASKFFCALIGLLTQCKLVLKLNYKILVWWPFSVPKHENEFSCFSKIRELPAETNHIKFLFLLMAIHDQKTWQKINFRTCGAKHKFNWRFSKKKKTSLITPICPKCRALRNIYTPDMLYYFTNF